MDDFAFPDEENLLKMQKEYEKVLGGKNVVSSLSLSKNGGCRNNYFLKTLILAFRPQPLRGWMPLTCVYCE